MWTHIFFFHAKEKSRAYRVAMGRSNLPFYRLLFLHRKNITFISKWVRYWRHLWYCKQCQRFERNKLKNQRTFFFTRKTRFLNMFTLALNSSKYEESCLTCEIDSICNVKPLTILYFSYACFSFLFVCLWASAFSNNTVIIFTLLPPVGELLFMLKSGTF